MKRPRSVDGEDLLALVRRGDTAAASTSDSERTLVAHVERFLLELGSGFAFVGRQVHLEVGGDDFKLDLLSSITSSRGASSSSN